MGTALALSIASFILTDSTARARSSSHPRRPSAPQRVRDAVTVAIEYVRRLWTRSSWPARSSRMLRDPQGGQCETSDSVQSRIHNGSPSWPSMQCQYLAVQQMASRPRRPTSPGAVPMPPKCPLVGGVPPGTRDPCVVPKGLTRAEAARLGFADPIPPGHAIRQPPTYPPGTRPGHDPGTVTPPDGKVVPATVGPVVMVGTTDGPKPVRPGPGLDEVTLQDGTVLTVQGFNVVPPK